jgi:seryl-tRNA synthetase
MIDIKQLRENPDKFKKGSLAKDFEQDTEIDIILEKDIDYRKILHELQSLYEKRNIAAKERNIDVGKKLKEEVNFLEDKLKDVESELSLKLTAIPNPPAEDVKIGTGESANEIYKSSKQSPREFSFKPLDHVELGEKLDIIDIERATKVSGARFAYLKNEGVLLEFALINYAMDKLIKEGFVPIIPPVLIRPEVSRGLGYWEAGGNDDYYLVFDPKDDPNELTEDKRRENDYPGYYLVGTAEHAIVPMHKDEVLKSKELPKRYVAFSSAFRREAGSYGKDTRGILRVHQFDKVEMVSFVTGEQDKEEHEYLLSLEEKFFTELGIPYQVIKMGSGDLGFPIARKYDIEAWIPTQGKYREVTSASTATDFQSRRLNIKYQDGEEKKFAYILNGTAFAIGRTIIAILENYQQEDGSVVIPEILRKYMNGIDKI